MSSLNRTLKLILGLLAIWPILYIPIFFGVVFSLVFFKPDSSNFPAVFFVIIPLHLLTILSNFVLLGLYILDLLNSEKVEKDKRTIWAVFLVFAGFIAMPIYWYQYIWKVEPKRKTLRRGK